MRRKRLKMIKLLRQLLLVIAMLGVVSAGAFAQRKDRDKRPPKEPAKVITNDRKDQRPPRRTPINNLPNETNAADLIKAAQKSTNQSATKGTKATY